MTDRATRVPHLDDTVTPATLHRRCEEIAVPDFDWINQPILAVVDGFLHLGPRAETPETGATGHV